jgi:hypothetical protein
VSLIPEWLAVELHNGCRNVERIADGLERRNALIEESNAMAREHNEASRAIVAAAKRVEAIGDIVTCDDCDRKPPLDWATTVDDVHFCPSCSVELMAKEQAEDAQSQGGAT